MFFTFKTEKSMNLEQAQSVETQSGRRLIISRACDRCRQRKRSSSGRTAQIIQCNQSLLQDACPLTLPDHQNPSFADDRAQLPRRTAPALSPFVDIERGDITPPRSTCPEAEDLETLQPVPDERDVASDDEFDVAGISQNPAAIRNFNQDVNTLPLSIKHPNSYLGVSMPPAVLRVIRWLYPDCTNVFAELRTKNSLSSQQPQAFRNPGDLHEQDSPDTEGSSAWNEVPLINAYFTYFHPSQPLLDERYFRATYMAQKRKDARWNLLLNVVLALGSIAANTAEDQSHRIYYNEAKRYLGLEVLGVHWETVQALGLLGGVYLHHIRRPDEGIAMVGSAMRMALALGLHRDYSARLIANVRREGEDPSNTLPGARPLLTMEMRSRIWWALFNIDTWGCSGLGRPSMGRLSDAVTAKIPTEPIGNSVSMTELFRDSVKYCMISTQIEDAMALSPLIDDTECKELDKALTDWFQSSSVQGGATTESARIAPGKNVLRWRYHFSRIILHRPILLLSAMHKRNSSASTPEQKHSIEICRKVADELITDIAMTWQTRKACQFSGTHAAWILYQAAMVPLLSLFSDYSDPCIVAGCRRQVEVATSALLNLQSWSPLGKQFLESVSLLYEASQRYSTQQYGGVSPLATQAQRPATFAPFTSNGEGDPGVNEINEDEHNSLEFSSHGQFTDSDTLDDLNWYTDWNGMNHGFDFQDTEWRL